MFDSMSESDTIERVPSAEFQLPRSHSVTILDLFECKLCFRLPPCFHPLGARFLSRFCMFREGSSDDVQTGHEDCFIETRHCLEMARNGDDVTKSMKKLLRALPGDYSVSDLEIECAERHLGAVLIQNLFLDPEGLRTSIKAMFVIYPRGTDSENADASTFLSAMTYLEENQDDHKVPKFIFVVKIIVGGHCTIGFVHIKKEGRFVWSVLCSGACVSQKFYHQMATLCEVMDEPREYFAQDFPLKLHPPYNHRLAPLTIKESVGAIVSFGRNVLISDNKVLKVFNYRFMESHVSFRRRCNVFLMRQLYNVGVGVPRIEFFAEYMGDHRGACSVDKPNFWRICGPEIDPESEQRVFAIQSHRIGDAVVAENHRPSFFSDFLDTVAVIKTMHAMDFVHGDIRPFNMMFDDGRGYVIDFDWAGKHGSVFYPPGILKQGLEIPGLKIGADDEKPILIENDIRDLVAILDFFFFGERGYGSVLSFIQGDIRPFTDWNRAFEYVKKKIDELKILFGDVKALEPAFDLSITFYKGVCHISPIADLSAPVPAHPAGYPLTRLSHSTPLPMECFDSSPSLF